ncbi:glycosyltransferase involved in cell wall biosynthesis [Sporomusaceae bacterium BoRhaA]|uniref:glycosyltransferase family 2 protein n=1 Tax=Pelorhabdus rhamnosifermentans TaxID=2772457 RepID=UPI001C062456|nr:glycosyltransferase family 2 protein [Pelorhabdus rhamnosifermentans]MBU2699016.1 glycosyltransferase involved in cell wall biosynthesis [Pelorhabdus rhamnosifermentans]
MSLSVIILAKNEEKNIQDCIESALFADEVLVIDDFSTDATVEIATKLGAKVYQHAMDGNWGAQQTYAIDVATTDWIFFLDADERIPEVLQQEIKAAVTINEKFAYQVPRLNHAMGEPLYHGGWYPDYGFHLMPRENFRVEGFVHPQFVHPYQARKLKNHLIHYTYSSWEQYFNKLNNYTRLAAEKNYNKGKHALFIRDIVLRPCFAFIKMYLLQSGWRDGRIGFILASFHFCYTMAKYVKLYALECDKGAKVCE